MFADELLSTGTKWTLTYIDNWRKIYKKELEGHMDEASDDGDDDEDEEPDCLAQNCAPQARNFFSEISFFRAQISQNISRNSGMMAIPQAISTQILIKMRWLASRNSYIGCWSPKFRKILVCIVIL